MSSKSVRFEPLYLSVLALLLVPLAIVGCHEGSSPTAPAPFISESETQQVTASARQSKTDVCHVEGNGSYHPIRVADPAVSSHVAHGDWLVTDEVCGDGIDNDCDGQVDEDCNTTPSCPCYSESDLDAAFADGSFAFCVADPVSEVYSILDLADLDTVQNLGQVSSPSGGFECELQAPPASVSMSGLSAADWGACNDLVVAKQANLTCF